MIPAVLFEQASVRYGARRALDDATAMFASGAVTGIVGPNGAGKTTLLKAASRLVPLGSGTCSVLGRPLGAWPRDALARAVAYLPQGGNAAWPVTGRRLAALGRLPHGRAAAADRLAVERALERADAGAFAERRLDELSSGERARVLFARALATEAPILLADEPAAHLDPAHQLRLMELLREEARRGAAVAVTLHELALAARFCDRILLMDEGCIVAQGPPEDALGAGALAEVFGVEAILAPGPGGGPAAVVPWRRLSA